MTSLDEHSKLNYCNAIIRDHMWRDDANSLVPHTALIYSSPLFVSGEAVLISDIGGKLLGRCFKETGLTSWPDSFTAKLANLQKPILRTPLHIWCYLALLEEPVRIEFSALDMQLYKRLRYLWCLLITSIEVQMRLGSI